MSSSFCMLRVVFIETAPSSPVRPAHRFGHFVGRGLRIVGRGLRIGSRLVDADNRVHELLAVVAHTHTRIGLQGFENQVFDRAVICDQTLEALQRCLRLRQRRLRVGCRLGCRLSVSFALRGALSPVRPASLVTSASARFLTY